MSSAWSTGETPVSRMELMFPFIQRMLLPYLASFNIDSGEYVILSVEGKTGHGLELHRGITEQWSQMPLG